MAALLAAVPSYLVERVTEFYFLTSNPAFFAWSGDRTPIFISLLLLAALVSGYIVDNLSAVTAAFTVGIVILISLLYSLCAPNVCYSTGIYGLEPLRVFYFFSCLGIAGTSIGNYYRTKSQRTGPALAVISAATIGAVAYYPVVFAIAGTRLVAPFDPIPELAVVALLSFVFAGRITQASGWKVGLTTPVAANLFLLAISLGIAGRYLPQIFPVVTLLIVATLLGAGIGSLAVRKSRSSSSGIPDRLVRSNRLVYVALLLALLSTAVFMPDATSGVTPQQTSGGPSPSYAIGPSVYVGGFMTQNFIRPKGVSVTVDFAGTNLSSIERDNYLSAGMGVHSAHCCVDGIDFGYRFDVYLFHDGSELLVASAWEVCDWNMACGGHSWQNLMFFSERPVDAPLASSLHLNLEWKNRTVFWSFSVDRAPGSNFTSFNPPEQDNPYFIAGTLGNIPGPEPPHVFFPNALISIFSTSVSPGFYFFQYGIMSRYPIGHAGWSVSFACPSYLDSGNWRCIGHSDSIQGDQSYWKVIWRWGEPYDDVIARSNSTKPGVTFSYSSSTLQSFSTLW